MIKLTLLIVIFFSLSWGRTIYREDDASSISIKKQIPSSHIKVYIPTFPYLNLSKLINGTLVRSNDNENGWDFMLATKLEREGQLIYTFTLREGVKFQDGTLFDADSVMENFNDFIAHSHLYEVLRQRLKKVEKLSKYKIRFTFNEPFELFLDRLTRINIYSNKYLQKFGWAVNTIHTAVNTHEPGPYGLGPYILKEGYATGQRQTPIIELESNPYYYEKGIPYINKITIYTQLSTQEVLELSLKKEGGLDISPIPFNKKVETVLSPYSKLVTSKSKGSISVLFNLLNPNSPLKDERIRKALNQAIDQEKLLKFVYKSEGDISPSALSKNLYSVNIVTKDLPMQRTKLLESNPDPEKYLRSILNGLTLNVYTTDEYIFLWKGIEFQLSKYGVTLNYTVINSAKEVFTQLFENIEEPKQWDILTMGNDSWASNNPWSMFFHYRTGNIWSALNEDLVMTQYLEEYSKLEFNSSAFVEQVRKIIERAYDKAYILAVPSPNIVLAVNKEVDYVPSQVLLMPLWKTKLTPYHWSIRKGNYPKERQLPIRPERSKK